ncbi:MAG: hypothetical protein AAF654_14995 [Myxococcota bacterium]
MTTWIGRVAGNGHKLAWACFIDNDHETGRWGVRDDFQLKLDDGSVVSVDVSNESLLVHRVLHRSGRWHDLEPLVAAQMFSDRAPAPDARVTLRYFELTGGDRVTVSGTLADDGEQGPGGSRILASHVVKGASITTGGTLVASTKAVLTLAVALLAVAAYAYAAIRVVSVAALATSLSLALLPVAIIAQGHLRDRLGFIEGSSYKDARGTSAIFASVPVLCVALGLFATYEEYSNPNPANVPLVASISVFMVVWCWLWLLATGFKTGRIMQRIAKAAPVDPPAEGQWGRVVGVVRDSTPLADGSAMKGERVESSSDMMDGPVVGQHIDVEQTGGFNVLVGEDRIHVSPVGATWATTDRRFHNGAELPFSGKRKTDDSEEALGVDVIGQGAAIAIVGRLQGYSMRATGPETLLMFASEPGSDVIGTIRSLLRRRRVLLLGTLLFAAAVLSVYPAIQGHWPDYSVLNASDD